MISGARRLLSGCVLGACLATASTAAAHGELFVTFGPSANIAGVGFPGSASISVSGIPPMSGSIGFTYDPAIVAATGILLPPRIGFVEGCSVSGDIGQGTVVVTFNCPAGPPLFLGTLAAIAFQGVGPGRSPLSFSSASGVPDGCLLGGNDYCVGDLQGGLPRDGSITVGGGNRPPTATCTGTRSGPPGQYHFVASASDPDGDALSYEWTFGDQSPKAIGPAATHAYAKPGVYDAQVKVTDARQASVVAHCEVDVAAPALSATLSLVDHESHGLNPDEEVRVRVRVSAGEGVGPLSDLAFDPPPLKIAPDTTLTIVQPPDPPIPQSFTLEPLASRNFEFTVAATGLGRVGLSSIVRGMDAADRVVEAATPSFTLSVRALRVDLTLDPPQIDLAEEDDGPVPKPVELTVKVTNTTDVAIENVTVASDLLIVSTSHTPPAGDVLVQEGGPDPDGDLGTLGPGSSGSVKFELEARDDGKVSIRALVEATDPDGAAAPLRGAGEKRVEIAAGVELYLSTELVGAGGGRERTIDAGAPALVTGYVENRANDQKIDLDPLVPILTGAAGNGNPVPLFRLLASGPQGGCTLPLQGVLEPGQKVQFQALVQTYIGGGTRGTISYRPSGRRLDDEGAETDIPEGKIRVQENTLPYTLHLDDSEPTAPETDLLSGVAVFSLGAVEAVPQWVTSFFLSAVEFPVTLGELTGKGLVSLVQGAEFTAHYFEGIWADPAARENLYFRVSQDIAEATGKSIEDVRPEVEAAIQGWAQPFFDAWARADYQAALPMLGQISATAALEIAVCFAKLPEAARFVAAAEEIKQTEVAKRLSEGLQALKAGDLVPFEQMRRLFGIAPEQAAALAALAEKKGLLITARFRQAKSLEWIRDFQAVLKPERIKVKNVDEVDHVFLGYKPRHEGSVVLKRPLDLSDARVEELYALSKSDPAAYHAAVDGELSRFSAGYSAATDELKEAARSRLATRLKEWVSPAEGYARDLMMLRDAGRVPLPWNYSDNFLPRTGGLPSTYTERRFGLQTIEGEADHWVVQMGDRGGTLRPVTGDIDLVGIQKANGAGLTTQERADIYMILQETAGMQHPETATWIGPNGEVLFKTKAEMLATHAPGGEPLLQFSPDGKQRAVFISPELSYFNTATGDAHLWYAGGYRQPKPAVYRRADGTSVGVYFPDKPIPRFVPYIVPGSWVLDGIEGGLGSCTASFGDGPDAAVVQPDGRGGLQIYRPGNPLGTWEMYDTSRCRGGGGGSGAAAPAPAVPASAHIELLPQSALAKAAAAGATEVYALDLRASHPELFSGPGSEFHVGQRIALNPGVNGEEVLTIAALGAVVVEEQEDGGEVSLLPLLLDRPLVYAHERGETVTALPAGGSGEPTATASGEPTATSGAATPSPTPVPSAAGSTPTPAPHATATNTKTPTPTRTPTATPTSPPCDANCDGIGQTTNDDLLTAVEVGLLIAPLDQCLSLDLDGDDEITVEELVRGVSQIRAGCR